jgi:5'-nucleotidase
LLSLADQLKDVTELIVVVPDGQRSASGKGQTLNRPLRITQDVDTAGYRLIAHDGAPADSIAIAQHFSKKIDLFVSGINSGANAGYQSILTSGTVGAAIEAALRGFPAIAISREVSSDKWFSASGKGGDCLRMCEMAVRIVMQVLEKGMPRSTSVLNLNFPRELTDKMQLVVTKPATARMRDEIERRMDPNGSPYYWVRGVEISPPKDTDVYEVLVRGNISISPITVENVTDAQLDSVKDFVRSLAL